MSDTRTIRDVLMDSIGNYLVVYHVQEVLGLDPDTVLERRCTCGESKCSGWIAVNRIVAVPAEVADADWIISTPEVERALRIGRAVLAAKPRSKANGVGDDDG